MQSPKPQSALSPANADQNLLFGILALQMDFITREALVAAMSAWVLDKGKSLSQILVEQDALTAENQLLLDQLVAAHVKQHQNDPQQSLASLSAVNSIRVDLERVADPDVVATLCYVANTNSLVEQNASTSAVGVSTSAGTRFKILRPHAAGGLGQISVALDEELGREVALKEIQPQFAQDAISRERFVVEAEITGGLEHPGVVPVYGLGQYSDGRPYYAMRLIKGDSLKAAIEAFHRPDNPNRSEPGALQLELRQLLSRFLDVCNAIDYAHSRGVLHRDLKPGNIMLGKYGETLVVDWGLAKTIDRKEITRDSSQAEATLRPASSLSSSGQTQPGSALGTPAYMSPEQAAGKLDTLAPTTDVYSLGATLFHLLTGKPPFEGSPIAVIPRVTAGEFPHPRQLVPEIPTGLEAICLKAMQLRPEDRYRSVRLLANDLEHWLADEPVSAQRDTFSQQIGRFSRRHRSWAMAGSIALIVVAFVSTSAALVVNAQRRKAELAARSEAEAKENADDARRLADENALAAKNSERIALENAEDAKRKEAEAVFQSKIADLRAGRLHKHEYRNYLRKAQDSLNAGDRERAMTYLELCPLQLRNWEWYRVQLQSANATQRAEELSAGETVIQTPAPVWNVRWSPDGNLLSICGGNYQSLRRTQPFLATWNRKTSELKFLETSFRTTVSDHVWGSQNGLLAAVSTDRSIHVWDIRSQTLKKVIPLSGLMPTLSWNPLNSQIFVSAPGGTTVIDPISGANVASYLSMDGIAEVSPDGRLVAVGSGAGDVTIFDAATGEPKTRTIGHSKEVRRLKWSPDGSRLATVSKDATSIVWNIVNGDSLLKVRHAGDVTGLSWSPDGKRLLTVGIKGTTDLSENILWDAQDGAELYRFPVSNHPGGSAAWNPDGKLIAFGYEGPYVKIFDSNWPAGESELRRTQEMEQVASLVETLLDEFITTDATNFAIRSQSSLGESQQSRANRVLTLMSKSHERSARLVEEIDHLDTLLRTDPTNWRLLDRRGRCKLEIGRVEDAQADFSRSIDLSLADGDTSPWIWFHRGRCKEIQKRWDDATKDYRDAIERSGNAKNIPFDNRTCLTQIGACNRKLKKWNDAYHCYTELIDKWGDQDTFRLGRASALIELGRIEEAAIDLEKAMKSQSSEETLARTVDQGSEGEDVDDPDVLRDPELNCWHRLALFQLESGSEDGYKRTCHHVLDRRKKTHRRWSGSQIGVICSMGTNDAGVHAEAAELAETAHSANQSSYYASYAAAVTAYRAGEFETAISRINHAMRIHKSEHAPSTDVAWDPSAFSLPPGGHPEHWMLMALANYRLGRFEAASHWQTKSSEWLKVSDAAEQRGTFDAKDWAFDWAWWAYRGEWRVLNHEMGKVVPAPSTRAVSPGSDARPLHAVDWIHSEPISLDRLRGQVVLLDFWAVWCGPCLASIPRVTHWSEQYGSNGLKVIGLTKYYSYGWDSDKNQPVTKADLSHEEERDAIKKFVQFHNMTYPVGIVSNGETHETYGVGAIPHFVLIDKKGKIRVIETGTGQLSQLEESIRKLLAEDAQ